MRAAYPEVAREIAESRLDEAAFADIIITTCPFCVTNLASAKGERKVEVVDLVELVDSHL